MITDNWLTTKQLGQLYGVSADAVKRWCLTGKYRLTKKVPGRGGQRWYINIFDDAIEPGIRKLWEKTVDKAGDGIVLNEVFADKLQKIIDQQQKILELLEKVVKKLSSSGANA